MKELSKELQIIYDFCEKRKNSADANAEATDDFTSSMVFSGQATSYWDVQQFIEVNFMED